MKTELTDEQLSEVKAWKPEWFKPVYKDNTWYKSTDSNSIMFNIKDCKGYGINYYGLWCDGAEWLAHHPANGEWREATEQEVEEALIGEAKRRGLVEGCSLPVSKLSKDGYYKLEIGMLFFEDFEEKTCLFKDGLWANVIENSPNIHTDIQALKDKYTDYNFTIIAEKK